MRAIALLAVAVSVLALAPQDPERVRAPSAPVGKEPLPPVPEPVPIGVGRHDLGRAWTEATMLEGFWVASSWAVNGRVEREGMRAYLAAGRTHLSIQVLEMPSPELGPLIQAGTRSYRIEDGTLVTTALLGFDNYGDRKLHLEPIGLIERRKLEVVGGRLRVVQSSGDWIEFQRIE